MLARYLLSSYTCLSVRLFVTSWSSTKTAKRMIAQTKPHDSTGSLVLRRERSLRNSDGISPNGSAMVGYR